MPSQAPLFAGKRKTPPVQGVTDQLAAIVRRVVGMISDPIGCRNCGEHACAMHQLRKDAQEALRALEAPEE